MDSEKQIRIGIDPDLDKSGVAYVDGNILVSLGGYTFFDMLALIDQNLSAHFVIEDVEFNKPVFARHGTNPAVREKIAQNIGMVKAVARLLIMYLEREGVKFTKVPPLRGTVKQAKTDAKLFNRLTGWTGRSNADNRDAALLALYGVKR